MSTKLKYLAYGILFLVIATFFVVIYRMFFQFNMNEIRVYVRDEAIQYANPAAVSTIIMEGVEHILASHFYTQQVLRVAAETGTDKEQVLVNAAINQCVSFKYLPNTDKTVKA